MGVGQHFNQAAYIGKYFSYLPQKSENINIYRNYEIEVLKIDDLFSLHNPTTKNILALIKTKPSFKLFSSNSIITKESEEKHNVNYTENKGFKYLDNYFHYDGHSCDYEFSDYFALHEARSISNYFTIRRLFYVCIFNSKLNTYDQISKSLPFLPKIKDLNFIYNLNQSISIVLNSKGKDKISNFDKLSRAIFNELYPLIWKEKRDIYNKRTWISTDLNPNKYTVALGTTPIIDFSGHNFKNIQNFCLFSQLPVELQRILKHSVVVIAKKEHFCLGIDTSSPLTAKSIKNLLKNQKKLFDYIPLIISFMTFFSLISSYKYLIFTCENQKKAIVEQIFIDFQTLKRQYDINKNNATLNGIFSY